MPHNQMVTLCMNGNDVESLKENNTTSFNDVIHIQTCHYEPGSHFKIQKVKTKSLNKLTMPFQK